MILVTGGLGFIGSHACAALLQANYPIVILDNLSNSKRSVLMRIEELSGRAVPLHIADLRDTAALEAVFAQHEFDAVVHFAGLKAVADSLREPLHYFDNNVAGTLSLLRAMGRHGVRRMVFSSSATVYGSVARLPVSEDAPLMPENPYGRTKQHVEEILAGLAAADSSFRYASLRYFNPVGAHPGGRLGEDPRQVPQNLMPLVCRVAAGRLAELTVHGGDWGTPDGTCIRDYVHVMDLAEGHVAALRRLEKEDASITVNLGTGRGHSVLELINCFEAATGVKVPYRIGPRRPGDAAALFADVSRSLSVLGWKATRSLHDMCCDAWRWQSVNHVGSVD